MKFVASYNATALIDVYFAYMDSKCVSVGRIVTKCRTLPFLYALSNIFPAVFYFTLY